jgi:hypothetical protein
VDFHGTSIPFPRDRAQRERTGDPRPSVTERYGDRTRYVEIVRRHAETLARSGSLLAEDVPRVVEQGERRWIWLMTPSADSRR